jgi:hypothetical protein
MIGVARYFVLRGDLIDRLLPPGTDGGYSGQGMLMKDACTHPTHFS